MNKILVLYFLATLFAVAQSLDFNDYAEGECAQYKPQSNFNTTWVSWNSEILVILEYFLNSKK